MANAIDILSELRSNYNCFDEAEEPYYKALSEAIKALQNGVEVIRCEKCKHWQEVDSHFHRSICLKNMCSFEENDHCLKAERLQDEVD